VKSQVSDSETVTFETISGAKEFALPLLSKLVGKKVVITDIRFGGGYYGAYAIVTLDDKKEYRTSSKVLIDQLKMMIEHVTNGKNVSAKLQKKEEYYTFV